jgi:hypothetical protein
MAGYWSITARASAGSASSASQAAPAAAGGVGQISRLRAIQCSLGGSGVGADQLVVRDGDTGTGTIIAQWDLSVAANGVGLLQLAGMDLRASPGNALTVEFVSGVTSNREDVNAQGDFVPQGYPAFQP